MLQITELPNMDPIKLHTIHNTLDLLLLEEQIITGYNWYSQNPGTSRVVTFSHIHETEEYKRAMLDDLSLIGHSLPNLTNKIRPKFGCFYWKPTFFFRDNAGLVFPNLCIRKKDGTYVDLTKYSQHSLENVIELQQERLIGENSGWELNLEFKGKDDLLKIVYLFLKKSCQTNQGHWPGAHDVPMLIIGAKAIEYAQELPTFIEARKLQLVENGNEISFIINHQLPRLRKMPHFEELRKFGFTEEFCLGNRQFIQEYVDGG